MKIYNKLFNYLNVIISLLFLTYIFYKSEIIFEGNKREYYIKYYILGFLYIIFLILILKLNKTINDLFNLSVISIVISLYTFEFYLIKKKR